jgi:hypothetical protein
MRAGPGPTTDGEAKCRTSWILIADYALVTR